MGPSSYNAGMHPLITFVFGCFATGIIVVVGAYYGGLKTPGVLLALGILAAGLQALFFLVWYLLYLRKNSHESREESPSQARGSPPHPEL